MVFYFKDVPFMKVCLNCWFANIVELKGNSIYEEFQSQSTRTIKVISKIIEQSYQHIYLVQLTHFGFINELVSDRGIFWS